jgi:hypothetical protein
MGYQFGMGCRSLLDFSGASPSLRRSRNLVIGRAWPCVCVGCSSSFSYSEHCLCRYLYPSFTLVHFSNADLEVILLGNSICVGVCLVYCIIYSGSWLGVSAPSSVSDMSLYRLGACCVGLVVGTIFLCPINSRLRLLWYIACS